MRRLLLLSALAISFCSKSQNLRSGGVLKPEQANMDIRHYTIALDVDPVAKTINGYTEIKLNLQQPSNVLLFDLWHRLTISQVWVNGKAQPFTHGEDDLIRINLAKALPAQKHTVKIAYGGTPGIAQRPPWSGGFQWEKDAAGKPGFRFPARWKAAKSISPARTILPTSPTKAPI